MDYYIGTATQMHNGPISHEAYQSMIFRNTSKI